MPEIDELIIQKKNEVFAQIFTSESIERELSDKFTFYAPGYQFVPAYRKKHWDGKIRLYNRQNKCIYLGLLDQVVGYAQKNGYPINHFKESNFAVSPEKLEEFVQLIQLDRSKFKDRDYQNNAILHALNKKKMLLLSPTSSGKSLIIYLISRYLLYYELTKKILIIVPSKGLVEQLTKDFVDYGLDEKYIHKIYSGMEKDTNQPITISTWQSLFRLPNKFFTQFDTVFGDEAQEHKATETKGILERLVNAKYRIGTTGSLDDKKIHHLVLQGLFGPLVQFVKTHELMDRGDVTKLKIKAIVLEHPKQEIAAYQDEIKYLVSHTRRNNFIKNLALSLKGNTLILFRYKEKHGIPLFEAINNARQKKTYYIAGETEVQDREEIRGILEREKNAILVASNGTFSRGVNIKNLKHIILAHPSKDKVLLLQSIGRSLRLHSDKDYAMLYDIADDLSVGKQVNYTLKHFVYRIKLYKQEKFDCKIYIVQLKD